MRDDTPPRRSAGASGRHTMVSVQVLRALAALSVVVHHAAYDADTMAGESGSAPLGLDRFFDFTFGIDLFFVISGFIMVRTARGFGEAGAPWRFLERRILRLVPLYWLMTTLFLAGAAIAPRLLNVPVGGWSLALGSYLFVPMMRLDGDIRPVLGQGWTLNYEMFFYAAFAASMMVRRPVGLALLAAGLVALVVAGRITSPASPPLMVWTDGLLLEFLAGIGVGLGREAGVRLAPPLAWGLALAGLGAAVLLGRPSGGGAAGIDPLVAKGLPAAMILAASVWGPRWPPGTIVLGLAALGDASYSLYLTHPFVIRVLRVVWTATMGTQRPEGLFLAAAVVTAVAASILIYRGVERPMTRALGRRFPPTGGSSRQQAARAAARRS